MSALTDAEWAAIMGPADAAPAEAWCDRCDQPTARVIETTVGTRHLCWRHASDLLWKMGSTAWNPGIGKAAIR